MTSKKSFNKFLIYFLIIFIFDFCANAFAGINDGLVAYYPFNGNANDESGNGNNGTVNGAILAEDRFGNPNNVYSFDGVNDYVRIPDAAVNNLVAGTITMWIYPTGMGGSAFAGKPWFAKQHNGINSYVVFAFQSGTSLKTYFHLQNEAPNIVGATDLSLNTWHHVTATWDGTLIKIYVNGIKDGEVASYKSLPSDLTSTGTTIGAWIGDGNGYFKGSIDDVRIYNRALLDSEIQELYTTQESYIATISGNITCAEYTEGSIFVRAFSGPDPLKDTLLGSTEITAPGSYTIENLSLGSQAWVSAFWDKDGSGGTFPTNGDYERKYSSNPIILLEDNPGIDIDLNTEFDLLKYGLVAYYPFNGNANDDSGNGNNGTVNGATLTTDRFGNPNSAYNFNGSAYIEVPDDDTLDLSNNLTITAWIKSNSTAGARVIAAKYSWAQQAYIFKDLNSRLNIELSSSVGRFANLAGTSSIPLGEWTFVAITYDSNFLKLYFNGVQDSSASVTGTINNSSASLFIGAAQCSNYICEFFDGVIDDVRIHNRALSEGEIQELAGGINRGLVAYYPFNGNASDESGNGNNGAVNGATLTTDRFGNANSAYSFDGVDDYINCGSNSSLDPSNQITISAWIKRDRLTVSRSSDFIVGRMNTNTTRTYYLAFWYDKLQMEVSEDGSLNDREFDESFSSINDNNWHHVAGTFDGNTIKLYIDGVYNCEETPTGDAISINQNFSDFIIGYCQADSSGYYFDGIIDDVRIYNRALSEAEIQELYGATDILVSENLGSAAYTASSTYSNYYPTNAFDGDWSTLWNSNYPVQWIEVDLGRIYQLNRFILKVAQTPNGNTTHQILLSNSPIQANTQGATIAHTFSQSTVMNQILETTLAAPISARFVQVRTLSSPSWVGWYEIQVYALPTVKLILQPDSEKGKDAFVFTYDDCGYNDQGIYTSWPLLPGWSNNQNTGKKEDFYLRKYGTNYYQRNTFIQFDLSDLVGQNVISAKLDLYFHTINWVTRPVGVYKVTSAWDELNITGNNQPSIGSQYASTNIVSGSPGWYSWDITNLVKEWASGTANYGMVLIVDNTGDWNPAVGYTSDYNNAALRPKLEVTYALSTANLLVIDSAPKGIRQEPLDHLDVTFSKEINPSTFTTDDISMTGPDGPITVNSPQNQGGNIWRITFLSQSTSGAYHALIGPHIEDLYENEMDQNGNGTGGEDPGDIYDATFSIQQDEEPPDTQITSGPTLSCSTSIELCWTGTDNVTPPGQLRYSWQLDNAEWSSYGSDTCHQFTQLSDGDHIFYVRAQDSTGNTDTTPATRSFIVDTSPPTIGSVNAAADTSTVTVTWTSNEPCSSQVEYGATDTYGSSTNLNPNLVTSHQVVIYDLVPESVYHYRVKSKDRCGFEIISTDYTFTTTKDIIPPETTFTSSGIKVCDTTIQFCWTALDNVTQPEQLEFSYQMDSGEWSVWSSETCHDFMGLSEGTHTILIKAKDTSNNVDPSPAVRNFFVDLTAPSISNITVTPRDYWASVTWYTSEPATSQVEYGESSAYGSLSNKDVNMVGMHIATFSNLSPQTTYHFRVKSNDGCREVISDDVTFTTTAILYPNLRVMSINTRDTCRSLERINFGWLLRNDGPGDASGQWVDKVFLSTDAVVDPEHDTLLVEFNNGGLMQETERWQSVNIDMPMQPPGAYYIIVQTDANNMIEETQENDNTFVKQIEYLMTKQLTSAPDQLYFRLNPSESAEGEIELMNLGTTNLTGLTTTVENASSNITVQVNPPANINGLTVIKVDYTVSAIDESVTQNAPLLRFSTTEGPETTVTLNLTVNPRYPNLVTNPGYLETTMVRGGQTMVEFEVTNTGAVPAINLKIIIPPTDWLTLATQDTVESLGPGEKIKVVLDLKPGESLPLGPYTGSINLSANNGGTSVNFRFTAISDRKGGLKIIAQDEFTYFADDHPPVVNATIKVKNSYDSTLIAEGSVDSNGQFITDELLEGYYNIEVSAEEHGTYNGNVQVVAGTTSEVKAFLPRQLVTYTWKVEPVETEDRYIVNLEATFETHVPAPVVTVEPTMLDLSTLQYDENGKATVNYSITNHGLIAANGAIIQFETHPDYQITPLSENIGVVAAMSSIVVPVTVQKLTAGSLPLNVQSAGHLRTEGKAFASSASDCDISVQVGYYYICDGDRWQRITVYIVTGGCPPAYTPSPPSSPGSSGPGSSGGPSGPGASGKAVYVNPPSPINSEQQQCRCDFSRDKERCYGGVGGGCDGVKQIPGVADMVPNWNTCQVCGWVSPGSILHDKCCVETNNKGCWCKIPAFCDEIEFIERCGGAWNEAWRDADCGKEYGNDPIKRKRMWQKCWPDVGGYYAGNSGDDTTIDLSAPKDQKVNPGGFNTVTGDKIDVCQEYDFLNSNVVCFPSVCPSGRCRSNSNGVDECGKYCECE